jgi:hypothetical protein
MTPQKDKNGRDIAGGLIEAAARIRHQSNNDGGSEVRLTCAHQRIPHLHCCRSRRLISDHSAVEAAAIVVELAMRRAVGSRERSVMT